MGITFGINHFSRIIMKNFVLLSEKPWHDILYTDLLSRKENWIRISSKQEFTLKNLSKFKPEKIFIPHWSYIIPEEIWKTYDCVVFHMTDLPFGRGGSPLQNLIVRGLEKTKITALKVDKGIDTGDVYIKKNLNLDGTAREIFERSIPLIKSMIVSIIDNELKPLPQTGDVVEFVRRRPEQSDLSAIENLDDLHNHIRMLDCDGYPKAFFETPSFKLEFSNSVIISSNSINANVRIIKK